MYLAFWKIKMWFAWALASKNDRWLHSPWLFELYQMAFRKKATREEWVGYEQIRLTLKESSEVLEFTDPGSGSLCIRTVGEQAKRTLLTQDACQFLSLLADHLSCTAVVELGSSLGITTLYLADNGRRVVTIEGAEPVAKKAEQTFAQFPELKIKLVQGQFDRVLAQELEALTTENEAGAILVWLDGHHQEQATQDYVELIFQVLGQRAVVVLDDIRWSPSMHKAWIHLCQSGRWSVCIDLHRMGILVANPVLSSGHFKLRPPISSWLAFA